jgi:hypothetical protein
MKTEPTIRNIKSDASIAVVALAAVITFTAQSYAQSAAPSSGTAPVANGMTVTSPPAVSNPSPLSPVVQYFAGWFSRVTRIQSEQPHWVTPIVTVTPRLEEEYRYDQLWQSQPHGKALDNFGANKGLELIPFQNTEIILGVPGWMAHNGALPHKPKKGKKPGPKRRATAGPTRRFSLSTASSPATRRTVTTY